MGNSVEEVNGLDGLEGLGGRESGGGLNGLVNPSGGLVAGDCGLRRGGGCRVVEPEGVGPGEYVASPGEEVRG